MRWPALDFGQLKKGSPDVFAGAQTTPTGWRKVKCNVPKGARAVPALAVLIRMGCAGISMCVSSSCRLPEKPGPVRQRQIAAFSLYFCHLQGVD
ncbi:hypothetical protein Rfer_4039 [Rhodoferax ferrireducens T118]|uniref:Uncharacterized protein n=1 Tax=Albidiferax ferrireducens (strain ATCC BAA-621 / DSM 15236 / T118) TaxID=338969 RepID=Q21R66_ALBFT|nr:hypothetical protein Rfer_4039 [Rhodoferax ferrireducens T118]